ncbi:FkbM family methyltransferase [Phenylobacterium immobile]|uniref:FkbM family methyltransferase n=1 Tax=Phenylobacterium immobile TaxID=21 RepID=UPI00159EEDB3|nr:FkbM family methyltransferase [Phenylobacterium immobile]
MPDHSSYALVAPRTLLSSPDKADWEGQCRRLAFAAYLGDDTMLCRTLARFKMYVSTRDEGLGPHLIADGFWEMWVTKVMTDTVMPGMVCIDAGANVGYYTVLLGELTGHNGKVVAIEPMPGTRRLLERNVAINGFSGIVDVKGVALGDGPGTVTLYMPPGEPKNALICETPPHPDWESATVPLTSIDDMALPKVDFVKIDVEGAEMGVWRGMRRTILANPQIQIMMEVNCRRYPKQAQAFMKEITDLFKLRHITYEGTIKPITLNEVLEAYDDVMLFLKR